MKIKVLFGGLVLLAFAALLMGQASFGPASAGGGSATNAVSTVKTNGTTVSSASTSLNLIAGANVTLTATNTAGVVDVRVSASLAANTLVASGTVVLSSGTNKVSTASANATNIFMLAYRSMDGSLSTVGFKTIVADTSFTIFSGNSSDTNSVDYVILKP